MCSRVRRGQMQEREMRSLQFQIRSWHVSRSLTVLRVDKVARPASKYIEFLSMPITPA